MKIKVRISLIPLLQKLMQELEAPDLEVHVQNSPHNFKTVVISFDVSKIPFPIIDCLPEELPIFQGQDRLNPRLAEHKAVMLVVQYLEKTHGIEIHDYSRSELISYKEEFNNVLFSFNYSIHGFKRYLNEYQLSISLLDRFLTNPSLQRGSTTIDICNSLFDLRISFQASVDRISKVFAALRKDVGLFSMSGSPYASSESSQSCCFAIYVSEKEILNEYMKFFGLLTPQYSTSVTENHCFIGTCSFFVGPCSGSDPVVRSHISGDVKESPAASECFAARKAIHFIQQRRDIEIVDFNYDSLVVFWQNFENLLALRSQFELLVSNADSSWSHFCGSLQDFVHKLSHMSAEDAIPTEQSPHCLGRSIFLSELEAVIAVIKSLHSSALPFHRILV